MFEVCNSSAGSGKTFTLANRYLSLCLGTENPNAFRSICALTFTNKAANEMKSRVIEYLKKMSSEGEISNDVQDQLNQLQKRTGQNPEVLRKRAAKVLHAILNNYSDFTVSTLDKFTIKLLRAFASDLNLPADFQVELDKDILLNLAVNQLLDKVHENAALKNTLLHWLHAQLENEKTYHLQTELVKFGSTLFSEDIFAVQDELGRLKIEDHIQIRKDLAHQEETLKKQIVEKIETLFNKASEDGADASKIGSRGSISKYLLGLKKNENQNPEVSLKLVEKGEYYSKSWAKDQIAWIEANETLIAETVLFCYKTNSSRKSILAVLKNFDATILLNALKQELDEIKWRDRIIHISEFNKKIADLVALEPAPYIYERLGEKFNHYLIDEFQDTSTLQWMNLIPLLENALSKGKYNLVVGDAKQAIYRFRGGNAEQFSALPGLVAPQAFELVKEKEPIFRNYHFPNPLEINYRSELEVIDFNNTFFKHLIKSSEYEVLAKVFKGYEQQSKKTEKKGSVHVNIIPKQEAETADEIEKTINEKAIIKVKEAVKAGYSLNEIAILGRKASSLKAVATALEEVGIAFDSSESLNLEQSYKVRFLLSFLKVYADSKDRLSGYEFCYCAQKLNLFPEPFHQVGQAFRKEGENLFSFLEKRGYELKSLGKSKQVYSLLSSFLALFPTLEWDEYLSAFMELVYEKCVQKGLLLNEFLHYFEQTSHKQFVNRSGARDAVQLLTLHKSKGLEFKVCIVLMTGWTKKPGALNLKWLKAEATQLHEKLPCAAIQVSKALLNHSQFSSLIEADEFETKQDDVNLCYVGFTRAREHLVVLGAEGERQGALPILTAGLDGFSLSEEGLYQSGQLERVSDKTSPSEDVASHPVKLNSISSKVTFAKREGSVSLDSDVRFVGNYIHYLFEKLGDASEQTQALKKTANKFSLNAEEIRGLESLAQQILNIEGLSPFFESSPALKIEQSFVSSSGELLRPDRVLLNQNNCLILDFKSGEESNTHKEQLNAYKTGLAEMGYNCEKAYLLYVNPLQLIEA